MAMLPLTKKSIPQLSRRVSAVLVAVAVCAVAVPTIYLSRPAQALAEQSENNASTGGFVVSLVEQVEAAPTVAYVQSTSPVTPAAATVPGPVAAAATVPAAGTFLIAPTAATAPTAAVPAGTPKTSTPAAAPKALPIGAPAAAAAVNAPTPAAVYSAPAPGTFELAPKGPSSVEFLPRLSVSEKKITTTLDDPTDLEFADTPLSDVLDYIKSKHAIEIQLDEKGLNEAGVATSTPITKSIKDASLRSALRMMLGDLDLTYLVRDDVLWITSQEKAVAMPITRTYPVADLQDDGTSGGAGGGYEALIKAITTIIDPECWDSAGGPGSIVAVPSAKSIVISQAYATHEKVLELLRALRAARELDDKRSSNSSSTNTSPRAK
jgi:hypothetical protein